MALSRRTTVCLTEPQWLYLVHEAQRLGINVSDLIRRIIDDYRESKHDR